MMGKGSTKMLMDLAQKIKNDKTTEKQSEAQKAL